MGLLGKFLEEHHSISCMAKKLAQLYTSIMLHDCNRVFLYSGNACNRFLEYKHNKNIISIVSYINTHYKLVCSICTTSPSPCTY